MQHEITMTFDSSEELFRRLYLEIGDSILFIDADFKIVQANERTSEIFELTRKRLIGLDCHHLIAPQDRRLFTQSIRDLNNYDSWVRELSGLRNDDETFPIDLTVKRLPLNERNFFCLIIRDLTEYKMLKELLHQEKSHRREMYITLRNLMKAFEKERSGLEKWISHKIETLMLPALEKIKKETSMDIRNSYLNIFRDQLISITRGFSKELDGRFLSLTRTEMKICKFIQAGYSSKEIAEKMSISFETIQVHRRNIRKKLGLRGRRTNLYAYLSAKQYFESVPLN